MEVVSTIDFLMKTLYCDENKKPPSKTESV